MGQVQLSDRQSSFIFYLVHHGKGRTEAALFGVLGEPNITRTWGNSQELGILLGGCLTVKN